MAEIKTVSKNAFGKMLLDQYVDTSTGQIEVRSAEAIDALGIKGDLLAISTGKNWKIVDPAGFRRRYNNLQTLNGLKTVTQEEFDRKFNNVAVPQFNNDRAAVLNNPDNYDSIEISEGNRGAFFQRNIPLVIDPKTQLQVSSKGVPGTLAVQQSQPDLTNAPPAPTLPPAGTIIDDAKQLELIAQSSLNETIAAVSGKRGGTGEKLRYPLKPTGPFEYDFISITAYDYKPSGLTNNYKPDKNIFPGQKYEEIILPMQPNLTETNGVNWSDDQLNPVQKLLGKTAQGLIKDLSNVDIEGMGETLSTAGKDVSKIFQSKAAKAYATAYFAGQAVGANLVGRTTGMVINPNLELLFNGPNLRSFNFNFKLTPRSAKESAVCRKIIRAFKRNMAVSRTSADLFLLSPRIFKLKYHFKGGDTDHPFLNKFKPCALTNFAVNYTPDGSYATFDQDGGMTQYNMDFTFTEVMPIYAEDIPAGNDQTMGY